MCKLRLPSISTLHGGAVTFDDKKAKAEGEIVEWRAGRLKPKENENEGTYKKRPD
jgi:hypothetical protein